LTHVPQAEALIAERTPRSGEERVGLDEAAFRVLAEDVPAERDMPAFDRVTMDGIAVAFRDIESGMRRFDVVGVQAAGAPSLRVEREGHCIRVMTGAVLPGGTDTVVPVERLDFDGNRVLVADDAAVELQQFVHHQGSDRRRGATLLTAGDSLGPAEMAILASNGSSQIVVARLPRIAIISTGDELVGVDDDIEPYQIRSSNDRAIETGIRKRSLGITTRVRLRDDEEDILATVASLHERNDVLILSGGVSMGEFDFVPRVLERLGAELVFHRIEQKPGKPMWFGVSRAGKPVFALPGNPVSTSVCMSRYVVPALQRSLGLKDARREYVALRSAVQGLARLTYFLPVVLDWETDGRALAEPRPTNTSGDFASLAGTDGFVELAASATPYRAGTAARLFRW
jgi:molybdopterin molybdotransferase